MTHQGEVLLAVNGLKTYFNTDDGVVKSVDGVTFHINKGETLAVVGESGSGKSVTSLSVMRLIPMPPGKIVEGEVLFTGKDGKQKNLVTLPEAEMRKIRGNDISMIFQEPMTSLNPVYTVGDQIAEAVMLHQNKNKKDAMVVADRHAAFRGYSCSRQARQRVSAPVVGRHASARDDRHGPALQSRPPDCRRADHRPRRDHSGPDSGPDAQAAKRRSGMSILFITHNLGVVAEMADRVVVMYGGRVVEEGDVEEIFQSPRHPYTMGLLNSIPRACDTCRARHQGPARSHSRQRAQPAEPARGCAFEPRCKFAMPDCSKAVPAAGRHRTAATWPAACAGANSIMTQQR